MPRDGRIFSSWHLSTLQQRKIICTGVLKGDLRLQPAKPRRAVLFNNRIWAPKWSLITFKFYLRPCISFTENRRLLAQLYYFRSAEVWKASFEKDHRGFVESHRRPEGFVALLTRPASNIHSTTPSLGQLPLTSHNVSFDPCGEDPRSIPYRAMSVCCSLSLHRVTFTNLSSNNVLVTLYKVLEVHHDNWKTCFSTIFYQSDPHTLFKIPEKLQRVNDPAARVFYQPLTFT